MPFGKLRLCWLTGYLPLEAFEACEQKIPLYQILALFMRWNMRLEDRMCEFEAIEVKGH